MTGIIIATLLIIGLGVGFAAAVLKMEWVSIAHAMTTVGFTIIGVALAIFLMVGPTPSELVRALVIAGVIVLALSGVPHVMAAGKTADDVSRQRAEAKRNELFYRAR